MNEKTNELFGKLRQKAFTFGTPYKDETLEELASLVNEKERKAIYVGLGHHVEDFDYFYIEWEHQAAVVVKDMEKGREPGYTFLDFAMDSGKSPTELQGIYSTGLKTNTGRFGGRMGAVVTEAPGADQEAAKEGLASGMLMEALGAAPNSASN